MDGITERDEPPSFRERMVGLLCSFQPQLFYLFVLQAVFMALALFALAFVDPDSVSYPILKIDLFIIGTTMLVTGLPLYYCNRRDS